MRAHFPPDYGVDRPPSSDRYLEENWRKAGALIGPTLSRIEDKHIGYHANLAMNHLLNALYLIEARNGNHHD